MNNTRFFWCVLTAALLSGTLAAVAEEGGTPAAAALRAGFARLDITPPVGAEMPGGYGKHISTGVRDPLWVEAAWFSDGKTETALVGVDLIMIPREVILDTRKRVEAGCGTPGAHVMIGASHTHNGGPVVDCFGSASDPEYCRFAAEKMAEAVIQAKNKAVPCRLAWGSGHEDTAGFNRRFHMKDGRVITHPGKMNPDIVDVAGPTDPEVAVISAEGLDGKILGCVVNFAMHGTTMGGDEFSADWPCYLRQTVRGGMNAPEMGVVFLNGACGDVTQVDNRSPRTPEWGEGVARRVGMCAGAEALKVLSRAAYQESALLAVEYELLQLPIRELPDSDEELIAREAPPIGLGSGSHEMFTKEARFVREMRAKSPTVEVEVQAVRVGDAAIVSNTTEFFAALGLAIKKDSPFRPTMVVELANGYNGYCPTADAFKGGGYEPRTARSSYLAPGSGEKIVDASAGLLRRVAEK